MRMCACLYTNCQCVVLSDYKSEVLSRLDRILKNQEALLKYHGVDSLGTEAVECIDDIITRPLQDKSSLDDLCRKLEDRQFQRNMVCYQILVLSQLKLGKGVSYCITVNEHGGARYFHILISRTRLFFVVSNLGRTLPF